MKLVQIKIVLIVSIWTNLLNSKEKLKLVSGKEQNRILKLASKNWSIKKTIQEFGITEHKVKCARGLALKKEHKILAEPNPKIGKKLKNDVCNLVTHFFQQDEYCRCFPRMKDFDSVRTNNGRTNIKSAYCS